MVKKIFFRKKYPDNYFERDIPETTFPKNGFLRPDQYSALIYAYGFTPKGKGITRIPKKVVSVGCGEGYLENEFAKHGVNVTGIDTNLFNKFDSYTFIHGGLESIPDDFDTLIFCESIEHISEEEFEANWPRMLKLLKQNKALFIITNWEDFHPLRPDRTGWDHIRTVDDKFYDWLSSFAASVVVRKGSHLVLQF